MLLNLFILKLKEMEETEEIGNGEYLFPFSEA